MGIDNFSFTRRTLTLVHILIVLQPLTDDGDALHALILSQDLKKVNAAAVSCHLFDCLMYSTDCDNWFCLSTGSIFWMSAMMAGT